MFNQVMVCGDWHMNWRYGIKVLDIAKEKDISQILHVGDFGYTFTEEFLYKLDFVLEENDQQLWFIDGNHEDFDWLLSQPIDPETGLRPIAKHIFHIPRGHVWEWAGRRWMGLGGATSVDKKNRIEGVSWWSQEALSFMDIRNAMGVGKVDVMLTHDCPAGVDIPGLSDDWDGEAIRIAKVHQAALAEVVKEIKPELLIHGHFHTCYTSKFTYEDGTNCTVIGLDCDGVPVSQNYILVDLEEE